MGNCPKNIQTLIICGGRSWWRSSTTRPICGGRHLRAGIAFRSGGPPRRIGADYLAFYQTSAFKNDGEARTISYYAAIRRYQLLSRADMLPEEADHARGGGVLFSH